MGFVEKVRVFEDAKKYYESSLPKLIDGETQEYTPRRPYYKDASSYYQNAEHNLKAYIKNSDAFSLINEIIESNSPRLDFIFEKGKMLSEEEMASFKEKLDYVRSHNISTTKLSNETVSKIYVDKLYEGYNSVHESLHR